MRLNSVVLLLLAAAALPGCSPTDRSGTREPQVDVPRAANLSAAAPQTVDRPVLPSGPLQFRDVAADVEIGFHHHAPLTPERHIHLFMGSGVGWVDFDRDDWPDLFFCQGASFAHSATNSPRNGAEQPSNLLFQNQATVFADVTGGAGLLSAGYSMGIAAADYDNDGFADLSVTGYGENAVWRNNGDGSFTRVRLPGDAQPGRLSASCAWGDFDGDGNLDLFIANYAQLGPDHYPLCQHTAGEVTIAISCHPANLQHLPDLLYRNTGTGGFEEVSAAVGLRNGTPQPGLGVIAADLDSDGDVDLYVANDTTPNQLWINDGRGQFVERGAEAGVARNRRGACEAGMGVAAGDVDGNGTTDLFVTNYYYETNTLYRNEGKLLFADVTDELGLGSASLLRLGFGTSLADFDRDGWLDLLVANGHVQDLLPRINRDEPFAQLPLLFQNQRGRRFQDVSAGAGVYFHTPRVGRSTAIADFDRDGDLDVAVNHLQSAAALLANDSVANGSWIRIDLVGRQSNRGGVGAVLTLDLRGRTLVRTLHAGSGYLSTDEASMLIGLGEQDEVRRLEVAWPGGRREQWHALQASRPWRLVEGTGEEVTSRP